GDGSGTSDLRLWLKADYGVQKDDGLGGFADADDTNKVKRWLDASGYGVNAAQNTVVNQPSFKVAEVNDLPVVRFDGLTPTHYLQLPNFMDFSQPTIYIVGYRHDATEQVGAAFAVGGHFTNNSLHFL